MTGCYFILAPLFAGGYVRINVPLKGAAED